MKRQGTSIRESGLFILRNAILILRRVHVLDYFYSYVLIYNLQLF